jgi:hypothetical protein
MKIYTEIISRFDEESQKWVDVSCTVEDWDGPIAYCGGGDDEDPAQEARDKATAALSPQLSNSLDDMAAFGAQQEAHFVEQRGFAQDALDISGRKYDMSNEDSLAYKADTQAGKESVGGYKRAGRASAEKSRAAVKQLTGQARQQASKSGFAGAGGGLGDSLQDVYRGSLMSEEAAGAGYQSAEFKRNQAADSAAISMDEATNANTKALSDIQYQQNKAIADMKAQVSGMLTAYYSATEDASFGGQYQRGEGTTHNIMGMEITTPGDYDYSTDD